MLEWHQNKPKNFSLRFFDTDFSVLEGTLRLNGGFPENENRKMSEPIGFSNDRYFQKMTHLGKPKLKWKLKKIETQALKDKPKSTL